MKTKTTQLVHCHIPKTGGKTFKEIMKKQFDTKPKVFQPPDAGVNAEKGNSAIKDADIICGHFNFNMIYPHLRKNRLLFVWLRDPVERCLSMYNYWHLTKVNIRPAQKVRKEHWTVDAFFQKPDEEKDPWLYAYMSFLGLETSGRQSVYSIVDRAKANLELFDFIGITENFKKDVKRLKKQFGFDVRYRSKNVTPDWAKRTNITKRQRIAYTTLLQPEYEIYEHARELAYGYGK